MTWTDAVLLAVSLACVVEGDLLRMPPQLDDRGRVVKAPLQVKMDIDIRAIHDFKVEQEMLTLETEITLMWTDHRVAAPFDFTEKTLNDSDGSFLALEGKFASKIWMPDLQIDLAMDVRNPQYLNDASSFRIYEDGRIKYSTLLNYDVFCHMNFAFFPFDKQVCTVGFESFDFGANDLWLTWKEVPHHINPFEMVRFHYKVEYENTVYTLGDTDYTKVNMNVTLTRKFFFYFTAVLVPSALLLSISYLSLYTLPIMDSHATRIAMAAINITVMLTLIIYVYSDAPSTGYTTFMDWWLYPILYYCCAVLFEFILVQSFIEQQREMVAKNIEFYSRAFFSVLPVLWAVGYAITIAIYGWGIVDVSAYISKQI